MTDQYYLKRCGATYHAVLNFLYQNKNQFYTAKQITENLYPYHDYTLAVPAVQKSLRYFRENASIEDPKLQWKLAISKKGPVQVYAYVEQ